MRSCFLVASGTESSGLELELAVDVTGSLVPAGTGARLDSDIELSNWVTKVREGGSPGDDDDDDGMALVEAMVRACCCCGGCLDTKCVCVVGIVSALGDEVLRARALI